jgi:hypothetical protein
LAGPEVVRRVLTLVSGLTGTAAVFMSFGVPAFTD